MTKDDNQVSAKLAFSADFQESEGRHQFLTRMRSVWAPIVWRQTELPHPHAFENMSDMHNGLVGESIWTVSLYTEYLTNMWYTLKMHSINRGESSSFDGRAKQRQGIFANGSATEEDQRNNWVLVKRGGLFVCDSVVLVFHIWIGSASVVLVFHFC